MIEHDLNHRPRPCLNGRNACQVYFRERRAFTRWERRDAYVWITDLQNDIVGSEGVQLQAAWRTAEEAWLNMKGFITITYDQGKSATQFSMISLSLTHGVYNVSTQYIHQQLHVIGLRRTR